jgi:N-acylglucosamine 2-epimerase
MPTAHHKETLRAVYSSTLLDNVMPFWLSKGMDAEYGGIMTCLDRAGAVADDDKSVWFQGRAAWMFATLFNEVEPREDWLAAALSCLDFLDRHCADDTGRLNFHVTRDGRPIRKRRYVYSEAFGAIGHAAMFRATGAERHKKRAEQLFAIYLDWSFESGRMPPKFEETRHTTSLASRMIAIATAQELRKNLIDTRYDSFIDGKIEEIRRLFLHEELHALLENVSPDGSFIDHADGRQLNPGHAMECAWFVMEESRLRGGIPEYDELGATIVDWMWRWGWDEVHGGILYFRDVRNKPVLEYWHDMKFWWPHCEATIATLMAYERTGKAKYAEWHRNVHDWSFKHFADPEFGEWYGYLHRDGSVSQTCKGSLWKGPFHLPRMALVCRDILDRLIKS